MAANEILAAVSTDTGTNLLTQAEYDADAQRLTGNQPGVARAKLVNKMLRQVSLIAAAVAQYIASRQGTDITDALTPSNLALYMHTAMNNSNVAVVGGTADVITAAFTPAATVLQKGLIFWKAASANATTTPTLARDALAAKTIVKGGNSALAAGDIVADMIMVSYYDAVLDKEVLINPATGLVAVPAAYRQLQPFTATAAAGVYTWSIAAGIVLDVRAAALTSGAVNARTSAAHSVVLPVGATLGAVSGQATRVYLLELDNGGALEAAVINVAANAPLDESGVISTTAVSAGSTSANVAYSTAARVGVPYRVIGAADAVNTAGSWANPTLVIPGGSQAIAAMGSIGYGQTWQTVTRTSGVTYYNTTGKPLMISFGLSTTSNNTITIGGYLFPINNVTGATNQSWTTFIIPPGASYSHVTGGAVVVAELR